VLIRVQTFGLNRLHTRRLDEIVQAHRDLQADRHPGKLVVVI
jgi:hypothetical protein